MATNYQWCRYGHPVIISELDDLVCAVAGVSEDQLKECPLFFWGFTMTLGTKQITLQDIADGAQTYMIFKDQPDGASIPMTSRVAKWLIENGYTFSSWPAPRG